MQMQHIAIAIQLLNNHKYVTNQTNITISQFENGAGVPFKVKDLDGDCVDYVDYVDYMGYVDSMDYVCYVNENTLQIVLNYDNNIQGVLKIDRLLDINMYIRDKKSKTRFVALQLRQSILAKLGQIAVDVLTLCKV
jgi:hypothetical protein